MVQPSHRYDSRFDDDDEDFDVHRPRIGAGAGSFALLCALGGVACDGLIVGVWVLIADNGGLESARYLIWLALALVCAAFMGSVLGIVFGIKGQNLHDPRQRTTGLIGLILGIVALVPTALFGLFFFCVGLMLELVGNRGG